MSISLIFVPLCPAKLQFIILLHHIDDLTQHAIPSVCLMDECIGEETNATTINPGRHPVNGESHLLLHLALPSEEVRHKDLLCANADNLVLRQNTATAFMLDAFVPKI